MIKTIARNRKIIHGLVSALVIAAAMYLGISIWIIVLIGSVSGIIFGKVFCRWMCPLGFVMELTLGSNSSASNLQMYNYHKLGCPIAWVSGVMNRFSLFKIRKDSSKCTSCGVCDSNCYIATLNKEYSLYKDSKMNPATQYSCSKCLACVEKCPTKSLRYLI